MAFVSKKIINGKGRFYLEQSLRLLDGSVKKVSVYLPNYKKGETVPKEKSKELDEKVIDLQKNFAVKYYGVDSVFTIETIKRLEEIRLKYQLIIKKLTKNQWADIIDRFTVNFTYETNAIEGNSLTLKDVTMILQEKRNPKGSNLREVYETVNMRTALDLVFQNKVKLKETDILKLHEIVVKDTGVSKGYKSIPNFLVGRNVKTTPPENTRKEMAKLFLQFHDSKVHPLRKAAHFHGIFERIHPFEDGNGRVGRLLINSMLINEGYSPLIIRKSQRLAYFSALEAFDQGHKDKLERFLIEKCKNTYENFFKVYVSYLKK